MAARAAAVTDKIQVGAPKVPPQNLEAEQAVLGGVLIDPSAMHRVAELLTPIHFYREGPRIDIRRHAGSLRGRRAH